METRTHHLADLIPDVVRQLAGRAWTATGPEVPRPAARPLPAAEPSAGVVPRRRAAARVAGAPSVAGR